MSSADASSQPTPLYAHTYESLCAALRAGEAVSVDAANTFRLGRSETRAIFDWYLRNIDAWGRTGSATKRKMVHGEQVEEIAGSVDERLPDAPPTSAATARPRRVVHVRAMRAHRFAGLHVYGAPGDDPPLFEHTFEHSVTLIQGKNGAGKTALLNAITWCLTGHILRAGRPPELVEGSVAIHDSDAEANENHDAHDICVITPLPTSATLGSSERPLLLDTWVELDFVDDSGASVATVRREVQRYRGKLRTTMKGFDGLGLDPIALEVGTRMPGLLPYIQLGATSDLGKAVATLTGLRPLEDLAAHAARVEEKLRGEFPSRTREHCIGLEGQFRKHVDALETLWKDHEDVRPSQVLPSFSDKGATSALGALQVHFEERRREALSNAQEILGSRFDPTIPKDRGELQQMVPQALASLKLDKLQRLAGSRQLARLKEVSDEDLARAEAATVKILAEAAEVARLASSKDEGDRQRLYIQIASWLRTAGQTSAPILECPVCVTPLGDRLDPVTRRPVATHLADALQGGGDQVAHTVERWREDASRRLRSEIADGLFEATIWTRSSTPLSTCVAARPSCPDPSRFQASSAMAIGRGAIKADARGGAPG